MSDLIIGFTEQYYTLWSFVDETIYVTDANGKHWPSHKVVHYTYHKNISMDEEAARAAYPDAKLDMGLRGESTWTWNAKEEEGEDLSPHIIKFGRHCGQTVDYIIEEDFEYAMWMVNKADISLATRELFHANKKVWARIMEEETAHEIAKDRKELERLSMGHHYTNGEKVELEIAEVYAAFGFDTQFGHCSIRKMMTTDNKTVIYMGSNPPDYPEEGKFKIKATIKHDEYRGEKQTKIQRIKIIES